MFSAFWQPMLDIALSSNWRWANVVPSGLDKSMKHPLGSASSQGQQARVMLPGCWQTEGNHKRSLLLLGSFCEEWLWRVKLEGMWAEDMLICQRVVLWQAVKDGSNFTGGNGPKNISQAIQQQYSGSSSLKGLWSCSDTADTKEKWKCPTTSGNRALALFRRAPTRVRTQGGTAGWQSDRWPWVTKTCHTSCGCQAWEARSDLQRVREQNEGQIRV